MSLIMKKISYLLTSFLVSLIVLNCNKSPELIVQSDSLEFTGEGGAKSVTFSTNSDWRISLSYSDSWVQVSSFSGQSSRDPITVTVTCDPNSTYESRNTEFAIVAGELSKKVTIIQDANYGIVLSQSPDILISGESHTFELQVGANIQFDVKTDVDWLSYLDTKSLALNIISFKADANKSQENRYATLTFKQVNGPYSMSLVVTQKPREIIPKAIDLGLSVKWASYNLGATKPEFSGAYFAWGEVEPKTYYRWDNYKWVQSDNSHILYKKYYPSDNKIEYWIGEGERDGKLILDPEDDAATVRLGGDWRMPTREECEELVNECIWTWTESFQGTNIKGYIITSKKTGSSIFLPWAGYKFSGSTNHDASFYWSSSLDDRAAMGAYGLCLEHEGVYMHSWQRQGGCQIRPVTK